MKAVSRLEASSPKKASPPRSLGLTDGSSPFIRFVNFSNYRTYNIQLSLCKRLLEGKIGKLQERLFGPITEERWGHILCLCLHLMVMSSLLVVSVGIGGREDR